MPFYCEKTGGPSPNEGSCDCQGCYANRRIEVLEAALAKAAPTGHVEIAHDGFAGDIIGHYTTREGKKGVVVQQDGTRVVHVYGEKWIATPETESRDEGLEEKVRALVELHIGSQEWVDLYNEIADRFEDK